MWLILTSLAAAAPPAPFVATVDTLASFQTLYAVVYWGRTVRNGPPKAVVVRAHEDGRVVLDDIRGEWRIRVDHGRVWQVTTDGSVERPDWADGAAGLWRELRGGLASSTWVERTPWDAGIELHPAYQHDDWAEVQLPFAAPTTFLSVADGAPASLLALDPDDPSRLFALQGSGAHLHVQYLAIDVPLQEGWDADHATGLPPLPAELSMAWRAKGHPTPLHEVPTAARFTSATAPRASLAPTPCTAVGERTEAVEFLFAADPTHRAWAVAADAAAAGCALRVKASIGLAATGGQAATLCGSGTLQLIDAAPAVPLVLASVKGAHCTQPADEPTRRVHRATTDLDALVPPTAPTHSLQVRWSGSHRVSCSAAAPSASGVTTWAQRPEVSWACP